MVAMAFVSQVVQNRGFLLNNELTDFAPQAIDPESGLPYANAPQGDRKQRVYVSRLPDIDTARLLLIVLPML